ncbi:MAG: sigma-70 family RNA polymerase sigma factor [Acidimicrobiia bacterium]|nr:sigma-70 family RNA polymerase sigma factor [Acidimicrobiia bacterium]
MIGQRRGLAPRGNVAPVFDEVLAAAQGRAGWAFTQLYESLAPAVAGYIRAQGVSEAEDVTSEVFLAVLAGIQSFAGTEVQFRSWVFTIAHRRVVDARRTAARRPEFDSLDGSATAQQDARECTGTAEDEALRSLGTARVEDLLAALAPDQRDVVTLRILADVSLEEVAGVLGKRPGAVKALQRRAMAALRRRLSREGSERRHG